MVAAVFIFSPKLSSNHFVFSHYENRTGINSTSYVSLIGLLTSLYAFAGYEGAASLAEETRNPHIAAPRGIFYTVLVSFLTGLLTILGLLYGTQENINYILSD